MDMRRPIGNKRSYDPLSHLVFSRSLGEFVWDDQGRKYMDLVCGYSACNLGHAHPKIISAINQQISELTWAHGGESHERRKLEETLGDLWDQHCGSKAKPIKPSKVWLTVSGARGIEIAWKLAHARSPGAVVRFDLAYHGRSLASAHLSDTQRSMAIDGFGSGQAVRTIPFPRHLQGSCGPYLDDCTSDHVGRLCQECQRCLAQAAIAFDQGPQKPSILFLEPAIGARGYYFAPAVFFRKLVDIAKEKGLAVVSDEIQMGLMRTGPLFLSVAQGWMPDLLVLGKSLGGGIAPISAVIGNPTWIDAIGPGIESETFAGYPLACRIANETLAILQERNLGAEIERKGERFRNLLRQGLPGKVLVDGIGLANCISLENLPIADQALASKVVGWLAKEGVLVHLTGRNRNRIALIPSLLIPESSLIFAAEKIIAGFRAFGL
ncbi:MAG: aminotransferase class III-fold pyridoxal phosphate-dependent enzyme [Pirellula sp.]